MILSDSLDVVNVAGGVITVDGVVDVALVIVAVVIDNVVVAVVAFYQ